MYTFTVNNFKVDDYVWKILEDSGRWSVYKGCFDINYSSILTRLIQEAGRYCEHYASDLFIDWRGIEDALKDRNLENRIFLFGFRSHGVDGNNFVLSRYNNDGKMARYEYRSLWRLDITRNEDEIKMKLGRVF